MNDDVGTGMVRLGCIILIMLPIILNPQGSVKIIWYLNEMFLATLIYLYTYSKYWREQEE